MLKGVSNTAKRKTYYNLERLPKVLRDIFRQSRAMRLRTVTNKAEAKVLCKNETRMTIFRTIRLTEELNNVRDVAIKYDTAHLNNYTSSD